MKDVERGRRIRDVLCGALIGAGAILPGVSGGVLAVSFGIYEPFMEVLTEPGRAIPRYKKRLVPLALGWLLGFWGIARGLTAALSASGTVTTWLFIGLIAGTVPQLLDQAERRGGSGGAWAAFALCGAGGFCVLFWAEHFAGAVVPGPGWYVFCGILWGAGVVIPGMSATSVLVALGLYEPLLRGFSELDLTVLAAGIGGLLASVLLLARGMRYLLHRRGAVVFHGLLGFVAASTLAIVPTRYAGAEELIVSGLCGAAGFLLTFLLGRLGREM